MKVNVSIPKRERRYILGINIVLVIVGIISLLLNMEPIEMNDYKSIFSTVVSTVVIFKFEVIFVVFMRTWILFFVYYFMIQEMIVAMILALPVIGFFASIYLYKKIPETLKE